MMNQIIILLSLFAAILAIFMSPAGFAKSEKPTNSSKIVAPSLDFLFAEEDLFSGRVIPVEGYEHPLSTKVFNTGRYVESEKVDDPDFYVPGSPIGHRVKQVYSELDPLRNRPLDRLPYQLHPFLDMITEFVQTHAVTKKGQNEDFYSGPMGSLNGEGFTFKRHELPEKLVKISFCFGFDPFVFTGLVHQESKFYRYAKSSGKAVGFNQLTSIAYAEVSEQLGIMDGHSKKIFRAEGVEKVFGGYIDCYLGSEKRWVNVWQDPTSGVPAGKAAYMDNFVGDERVWKYQTKFRQWMDEDPDRNLIYGAILFKLYLGHFGNYAAALKKYNVSHQKTYDKNVFDRYSQLADIYRENLDNNPDLFKKPELSPQVPPKPKDPSAPGEPEDHFLYAYSYEGEKCLVDVDRFVDEFNAVKIMDGMFDRDDMVDHVYARLYSYSYCKSNTVKT